MTKDCSCPKCVQLCRHAPGWMSPDDARKAIGAGHAPKLMVDYLLKSEGNIYVLGPATRGQEGYRAKNTDELFGGGSIFDMFIRSPPPKGVCTFFNKDRCTLHTTDFKPRQCRETYGCSKEGPNNYAMAEDWNNPEAQALVREWMKLVGLEEDVLEECT
jgi:hypothetical protein